MTETSESLRAVADRARYSTTRPVEEGELLPDVVRGLDGAADAMEKLERRVKLLEANTSRSVLRRLAPQEDTDD